MRGRAVQQEEEPGAEETAERQSLGESLKRPSGAQGGGKQERSSGTPGPKAPRRTSVAPEQAAFPLTAQGHVALNLPPAVVTRAKKRWVRSGPVIRLCPVTGHGPRIGQS